eukprot:2763941-Pleurochrysis_carterae.AAC.1
MVRSQSLNWESGDGVFTATYGTAKRDVRLQESPKCKNVKASARTVDKMRRASAAVYGKWFAQSGLMSLITVAYSASICSFVFKTGC